MIHNLLIKEKDGEPDYQDICVLQDVLNLDVATFKANVQMALMSHFDCDEVSTEADYEELRSTIKQTTEVKFIIKCDDEDEQSYVITFTPIWILHLPVS